ncbi:MAG: hypothetical protein JNK48_31140 [Bryobacterales bacterium]|nr:hypothetical protein [Bryobacterales bacterium]
MEARRASDLLLAVRLMPGVTAGLFAVAVCLPAYLRFEPVMGEERTGVFLWFLATLSVLVCGQAVARLAAAMASSKQRDPDAPVLRLTGILSPRVVVSPQVRAALTDEQWHTVMRHEQAHLVSKDNLKRAILLLAPGLWPFDRGFGAVEKAWVEATERAADAAAVDGDEDRAVLLAEALVRVARLGLDRHASLLASSFATDADHLRERVGALLSGPPPTAHGSPIVPGLALSLMACVALLQPWLGAIHELLERLVD